MSRLSKRYETFAARPLGLLACYVLLPVIAIITFVDVINRYFLGTPFIWAHEVISFMLIGFFVCCLALCTVEERHVRMDLLSSAVSKAAGRWLAILHYVAGTAFGAGLVAVSLAAIPGQVRYGRSGILTGFPYWPVNVLVALVGLIVLFTYLRKLLREYIVRGEADDTHPQGASGDDG